MPIEPMNEDQVEELRRTWEAYKDKVNAPPYHGVPQEVIRRQLEHAKAMLEFESTSKRLMPSILASLGQLQTMRRRMKKEAIRG